MREKNPTKINPKRLSITYYQGELNSKDIQHAAFNLGFGTMSRLIVDLIQKFMEEHETGKNGRQST